jgi:hypothetical protein
MYQEVIKQARHDFGIIEGKYNYFETIEMLVAGIIDLLSHLNGQAD